MPEKIRRVRRKRRSRSLPGVESFPSFRLHLPPVRVALYVAAAAVAVVLIALFGTYSSKLYTGWRESRLLKRATAMLEKKDFVGANRLARAEGNLAEQEQQFAIAVNKDPQNDLYKFNLAALQIRSQEPGKSSQARDSLEHLTQVPEFRTGALRALLNDAVDHNDLQAADRFAQQLQMSPEVSFGDYLLCLNFYRKLDAEKFDVLLEKVKPVASRNSGDLGLLMDWMNENGLASEVVKWMDKLPEATTAKPPAAIAI